MSGHDEGGGASRSTDPAAGSSAATDVSLREYLELRVTALRDLLEAKFDAAQEAVKLALDAQKELAAKHNDLIRQGEKKDATYATKTDVDRLASWQSKITGGLIVLSVIGVANLVKVWAG